MLDANSMVADFRLQSAASTALMQQAATGAIRVVVPRVVLYEVINKYSEGLQKQLDEIHRQIRALKRFGVAFHDPSESADDLIGAYVKELDSKLKRHRVVVNDYPAVSHAEVAERAVAKRPPFNQQGQGYRDTLIWHTVLEVLASSEVWFVTTDGDFLNQSGELTAALLDDVDALGLTRERIRRFATIEQAVSTLGSIAKEAVTQLRDRLTNDATYYNAMSESIIGLLTLCRARDYAEWWS